MTAALLAVAVVLAAALVAASVLLILQRRARRIARPPVDGPRRILFPFTASALSPQALDASLRLARSQRGTLVPVFLARVSMHLPLDTPIPNQCNLALPLQETIEQRARDFDIPVDARIERGRTYRHALRQTINHERYDQLVVAASANGGPGFDPEDVAWLLDTAPGEIVVLRPGTNGLHHSRSTAAEGAESEQPPQRTSTASGAHSTAGRAERNSVQRSVTKADGPRRAGTAS